MLLRFTNNPHSRYFMRLFVEIIYKSIGNRLIPVDKSLSLSPSFLSIFASSNADKITHEFGCEIYFGTALIKK